VFLLLQRRLFTALAERLALTPVVADRKDVPSEMRTGKRERIPNTTSERRPKLETLEVKGFGDLILSDAIQEVLAKLRGVLLWVENIWGDLLEPSNDAGGIDGRTIKVRESGLITWSQIDTARFIGETIDSPVHVVVM
jgi:hypothetical protein